MLLAVRRGLRALFVLVALAGGGYPLVVGWQMSGALMQPAPFEYPADPARFGLAPENVAIQSPRTDKPLSGWLFKQAQSADRAVLFLHGWRSHKEHMLPEYLSWLAKRYTVLTFDHPGHGDSPPGTTTLGAREQEDAAAALQLLRDRGYTRIAVFGASMGGTTAIGLAAQDAGLRAVVSDATFATPRDLPLGYLRSKGFFAPELAAASTAWLLGVRTGADLEGASALANIPKIAPRPVLLIHGTEDHVILPGNAKRLHAAAGEPKQLYWVSGADHLSENEKGPHGVQPREYEARVTAFLDQALKAL